MSSSNDCKYWSVLLVEHIIIIHMVQLLFFIQFQCSSFQIPTNYFKFFQNEMICNALNV